MIHRFFFVCVCVCFRARLEQEIEELETGVPANKGVAKENGGKFGAHGNILYHHMGNHGNAAWAQVSQRQSVLIITSWFTLWNRFSMPEVI